MVPLKVKLRHMEKTIARLLVASAVNKPWLDGTTEELMDNYGKRSDVQRVGLRCLMVLKALLYSYRPALLAPDVLVRECNSNGLTPYSTTAAKECIAISSLLLMHIPPCEKWLTTRYLHTNNVAVLF